MNKWQRQKENDYQRWLKDQENQRQLEKERHDCPEYNNQYWEFRQSQTNRLSIHAQDAYHHNNMDQRLKNRSVHNRLGKQVVDQNWADHEEESNEEEYVW